MAPALTSGSGSIVGDTVDGLPQQVGVAAVAGVLLDHVHEDPPHGAPLVVVALLGEVGDRGEHVA